MARSTPIDVVLRSTQKAAVQDFDHVTHWPATNGVAEGSFPASWGQGRAVFGGVVSANAWAVAGSLVSASRAPLTIDCAFLGPVTTEAPTRVEARVLREGKYVTTVEALTSQNGVELVRCLLTFGQPRPSKVLIDPPRRPIPAYAGAPLPFMPGITPTFLQHFELTWAVGALPFSGAKESSLGGFCRHATKASGVEAIIGLLDAWPAPVLPLMPGVAAGSTVRWAAHLSSLATFDPGQRCFFESSVVAAHDGYCSTLGHLWDHDGHPIGWMEQLVAFFEPK